jgi:lycopene beta-cyclase
MLSNNTYDIIFTGGGAACRMLLYFLSEKKVFSKLKILVLEAENNISEKTWCFWQKENSPFQQLVRKEWKHLKFDAHQITITQSTRPFTYYCINGSNFNHYFNDNFFAKHTNITIYNKKIELIREDEIGYTVETENGTFKTSRIFNSISELNATVQKQMWQHFEGWFIKADTPSFDEKAASLMDFSDYDGGAFGFLYILPFSNNEALVECTFYSEELYQSEVYEQKIKNFLLFKGISAYSITKKEKGKIPLYSKKINTETKGGIIHISGAGGQIKPSTGYAFMRMIEDSKQIARSFGTKVCKRRKRHKRFLFYDHLLLKIIKEDPACAVSIFKELFRKQPLQRILKFLNEDSSLLDELIIFTKLPWMPFLKRIRFF